MLILIWLIRNQNAMQCRIVGVCEICTSYKTSLQKVSFFVPESILADRGLTNAVMFMTNW